MLKKFIGRAQYAATADRDALERIEKILEKLPVLYETEKTPLHEKTAWLRYFIGSLECYIFEAQEEDGRIIAFGLVRSAHDMIEEMEYIDISHWLEMGIELDLYFTPCKVSELEPA